jgi:hypothetical protein
MRRALLLLLASTTWLGAADLTGMWIGKIPTRNGEFADVAFQFKQTGATLAGKLYGDYKSSPIVEGSVTGDQVMFVVLASEQSGNQINESRLRFTGTLKDGVLELSRQREQSTNAGNSGGVQIRDNKPLSLQLKKLL